MLKQPRFGESSGARQYQPRKAHIALTSALVLFTFLSYFVYYYAPPKWQQVLSPLGSSASGEREELFTLHPAQHIFREPTELHHKLNISSGVRHPDGVAKEIFLINGAFPGPTIEARSGDQIVIEVTNSLHEAGVSLHYHGLTMREANEMDGVTGVTQCAIDAGKSFVYRFKIEHTQAGTFWYHAHSDVQRADGLYGAFIIHKPADASGESEMDLYDYDEEQVLMIGDWYHRSAHEILDYYMDHANFGVEPAPDSLLLNGRGAFNCSKAVPARPLDCRYQSPPHLVIHTSRLRLRVINVGALTGYTVRLSGYSSTLVTVDGGNPVLPAAPFESFGILYPGERIDVVVKPTMTTSDSRQTLTIALDREDLKFPNFALTPTQHFPIQYAGSVSVHSSTAQASLDSLSLGSILGQTLPADTLPATADAVFLLYTKVSILAEFENSPRGFINWTSWQPSASDALPLVAEDVDTWAGTPYVLQASQGHELQWVDVVLNNVDDKGHPFHLHGQDFYVLASHEKGPRSNGYEAYNPFDPSQSYITDSLNLINPPKKDTVFVPRGGYVVLRFRADKPGLWYFHCHVLWHEAVGMALAFQVGDAAVNQEAKEMAADMCRG